MVFIKKHSIFLTLLAFIILLSACENEIKSSKEAKLVEATNQNIPNSSNGIKIKMEENKYLKPVTEITVVFQNDSKTEVNYGIGFSLEKKVDGKWRYLQYKEGAGFTEEGYTLSPNEIKSETHSLEKLIDNLTTGEYRLIKKFDAIHVAAVFKVTGS